MKGSRGFCYLRLGDGELNWILRIQDGESPQVFSCPQDSINRVVSTTGATMPVEYFERYMHAIRNCPYLDHFELANGDKIRRADLQRAAGLYRNESADTSMIFYDWVLYEMRDYLSAHRCLILGSEAPLLRELFNEPEFCATASAYFPGNADIEFLCPPDYGRCYWEHLEVIREMLIRKIKERGIDTVFLSLSAGAKILGYEVSRDTGVVCFDFGSMCRALAYSATPGYAAVRSSHTPYFFGVPIWTYLAACHRAFPELSCRDLTIKAHAQLMLDLLRKNVGESISTGEADRLTLDPEHQDRQTFERNLHWYQQNWLRHAAKDGAALSAIREFKRWCRIRGYELDSHLVGRMDDFRVRVARKFAALRVRLHRVAHAP